MVMCKVISHSAPASTVFPVTLFLLRVPRMLCNFQRENEGGKAAYKSLFVSCLLFPVNQNAGESPRWGWWWRPSQQQGRVLSWRKYCRRIYIWLIVVIGYRISKSVIFPFVFPALFTKDALSCFCLSLWDRQTVRWAFLESNFLIWTIFKGPGKWIASRGLGD